jgi:hypothetical protein
MSRNASLDAYELSMAEELKQEAETVLSRGLATVTGSVEHRTPGCMESRCVERQEPIAEAVTGALFSDAPMAKLLAVLKDGTPEETWARVNSLRIALAKQIGEDNALGVVEARFGRLIEEMAQ